MADGTVPMSGALSPSARRARIEIRNVMIATKQPWSPSARRARIEITTDAVLDYGGKVALRKEGAD